MLTVLFAFQMSLMSSKCFFYFFLKSNDQLPTHSKVLAFTSQNVNFAIGKHCLEVIGSAFVLLRIHVDETTKYVKLTKNFDQKKSLSSFVISRGTFDITTVLANFSMLKCPSWDLTDSGWSFISAIVVNATNTCAIMLYRLIKFLQTPQRVQYLLSTF